MFGPVAQAGAFIRFTYGISESDDRFKEVMVLNPDWRGEMHAIDLKRITPAEREVLEAIMDPKTKAAPHRLPLVNDILRRMDPLVEIKNPMSFYAKFVKVFIKNTDCYRRYKLAHVSSVQTIQASSVQGGVSNPAPLFKKI
jgi:hypothetical protein